MLGHHIEPGTFFSEGGYYPPPLMFHRRLGGIRFYLCSPSRDLELLYSHSLRECTHSSNFRLGAAIHGRIVKQHVPSSLFVHNHLLNMYMKCRQFDSACRLFEEIPQRNVVSWSAVISGFVQGGSPQNSISMFKQMLRDGTTPPNSFTLLGVLHACSLFSETGYAFPLVYQVYGMIVRLGWEWNVFIMNALLTALIRRGQLVEALKVFNKISDKDIVSWNAMMGGYLQHSYLEVANFWFRMNHEGVKPDNFSFATVLTGLAASCDVKMGIQVHAQLLKSGRMNEICVANSLADLYIKNQQLEDGFKVFDKMPARDVCSWTQMASGSLQCGKPEQALELVEDMMEMGVEPNKFTLATAINACANLTNLKQGQKFHALRLKLGDEIDNCVDNALLDMYAKCGCMDDARFVFKSMDDHSVVSWTTMIIGCAQNGEVTEALNMFNQMVLQGVEPNYITYICVLYACSQGEFIDEGRKYFSMMKSKHGISPGEDHYICMVNLLGRAGYIKEAEDLILNMPFQHGVMIWQTLLSACHLHEDVETAKRAAERAIELNGKDSASYVLLSNMFAGLHNWDGVGMLREQMKSRDVKKRPGSSWL